MDHCVETFYLILELGVLGYKYNQFIYALVKNF